MVHPLSAGDNRNSSARFLLITIAVAFSVIILHACGPANQSQPTQPTSSLDAKQSTNRKPTPAPNNYPKLGPKLQEIVKDFETGKINEAQAAARARYHHDNTLLARISFPDNNLLTANLDSIE